MRGNCFETRIRRTSPVGVFPGGATPEGVLDISGNSWDWTSTLFHPYPYAVADDREANGDAGRRVVRGGSWNDNLIDARSAYRYGSRPGGRGDVIGFRLLFPAPISSDH